MWSTPHSIKTDKREYEINTDYRIALTACTAMQLEEDKEAVFDFVGSLIVSDWDSIQDADEVMKVWDGIQWYLDGGPDSSSSADYDPRDAGLVDWKKDWPLIAGAVSRVLGQPVRSIPYLHWWDFLAAYNEIGECTFSTVVSIRWKRKHGKKLQDWEKEFEKNNRSLIRNTQQDNEQRLIDDLFDGLNKNKEVNESGRQEVSD